MSKVADHTLELDFPKRHIPKKCSKSDEVNIFSSRIYDEELSDGRTTIKNKLSEITKKT